MRSSVPGIIRSPRSELALYGAGIARHLDVAVAPKGLASPLALDPHRTLPVGIGDGQFLVSQVGLDF